MILLAITTHSGFVVLAQVNGDQPIKDTISGLMSVHDGKEIEILAVYPNKMVANERGLWL